VVADVPGSRRVHEDNGVFRGSILGGADQADSRLSFVVPLLELILGDLARSQNSSRLHRRFPGVIRRAMETTEYLKKEGSQISCQNKWTNRQ